MAWRAPATSDPPVAVGPSAYPCSLTHETLQYYLAQSGYGANAAIFSCYFVRDDPTSPPLCVTCRRMIGEHPSSGVGVPVLGTVAVDVTPPPAAVVIAVPPAATTVPAAALPVASGPLRGRDEDEDTAARPAARGRPRGLEENGSQEDFFRVHSRSFTCGGCVVFNSASLLLVIVLFVTGAGTRMPFLFLIPALFLVLAVLIVIVNVLNPSLVCVTFRRGGGPQSTVILKWRRFVCHSQTSTTMDHLGCIAFLVEPYRRGPLYYVQLLSPTGDAILANFLESTNFNKALREYDAWCAYFEQYGIAPHPDRKPPPPP